MGDIVDHRADLVAGVLGQPVAVQAYSATTGFGLESLFAAIRGALPESRRGVFTELRKVRLATVDPPVAVGPHPHGGCR